MSRFVLRALGAALCSATLASCGGGGGGGTVVISPEPPPVVQPPPPVNGPAWLGFGSDSQHTSLAQIATQSLDRITWSAPVDLAPQYTVQGYLLTHYGSPAISAKNTVVVPVNVSPSQFTVQARNGTNGAAIWSMQSDYVMPPHRWIPAFNVTLTNNRVVAAAAGGRLMIRSDADAASATVGTVAFYGDAVYSANKAAMDASVYVNTPVTADAQGNLYFGFTVTAANPAGLTGGIARVAADGTGSWVAASTIAQDAAITKAAMNSAPALSADQKTLYAVVNNANGKGYIAALDAKSLATKGVAALTDPQTHLDARVSDDSTASPTVGPDGDVFIGVLETVYGGHNSRGWLLHFDASLAQSKVPGSFGWDDTPSVVPASMVPSYKGSSSYLVATKYNNYARAGNGDSKNKVAVLDPQASQADFISGIPVMQEVLTVLGPTPDPDFPGGVTEWCINVAAVDPFSKSILVNSEDGYLYRWDLSTNTLSQKIRLTSGLGESYTPTAVGADGKVYAINNAVLFSIGK